MSTVERIAWGKSNRLLDLVDWAESTKADYVALEIRPIPELIDMINRSIDADPRPDVVVVFDRVGRAKWQRLRDLLPASLYLIAAPVDDDPIVCFSKSSIDSQTQSLRRSKSLSEVAIHLADLGSAAFIESNEMSATTLISTPSLTTPTGPRFPSLRDTIHRIQISKARTSTTQMQALKAGFFLINDFFDESHSCSQSIEGMGPNHTGDYWHAILHRREPDYGNSKYWFRNVGQHPVFNEIAHTVRQHWDTIAGSLRIKLDRWKDRLLTNNRWDPFAFVDLCSAAEHDSEIREWCERVQHEEMLLLLEATYREAVEG